MAKGKCTLYVFRRGKMSLGVGRCITLHRLQRYLKHEHPAHVYAACMNLFNMGLAEYDSNKEVIKGGHKWV
jgi:hypothetical protein